MFGQNSVRSLHSVNSLTRSVSGDRILTALAAAAASVESGNNSSGQNATYHNHRSPPPRTLRPSTGMYKPPRRLGTSSTSSSGSSGRAGVGTDGVVSLPRERHDLRPSSHSDEETRLSAHYGLLSLSNSSSTSSMTNSTIYFPGTATIPTAAMYPTRPRTLQPSAISDAAAIQHAAWLTHESLHGKQPPNVVLPTTKLGRANTTKIHHQDIQLGPVLRASVTSWNPTSNSQHSPRYQTRANFSTVASIPPFTEQADKNLVFRPHNVSMASSSVPFYHHYSSSNTTASTATYPTMIEIAPGVSLPLRGAEETQRAIEAGFYVQCECWACPKTSNLEPPSSLHCILDCDYFLCPDCRSVAPNPLKVEGGDNVACETASMSSCSGGLGLGFRLPEQAVQS